MKLISFIIFLAVTTPNVKGQDHLIAYQEGSKTIKFKDSLEFKNYMVREAGRDLQSFTKINNAGYVLTAAGAIIAVASGGTLGVISGALCLAGGICFITANTKAGKAGRRLEKS